MDAAKGLAGSGRARLCNLTAKLPWFMPEGFRRG